MLQTGFIKDWPGKGLSNEGEKMFKEIQWVFLYFNYVTLHILPAGGENIYRPVCFYRKLCVLVRDWGKTIGLKPSEKRVYFSARGHVMGQWRASITTEQAAFTQPWIHSRLTAQATFPSSSETISFQLYKNDDSSEVPVYLHSISSVPSLLPKKLSNCSCFAGVVGISQVPASSFFL